MFVHDGIDLEIPEQTRGVVGDRRHIATLDLYLVTAVAVFLVHKEHDAWHVVHTDNRRENHVGSIVAGKTSLAHTAAVVSVLNGVLQRHGSCGHVHPC